MGNMKDLPDWTRQVVIRYEGGFIGLEELAARLGSIVPFDLRGNIVLMEDFESELTEWVDDSDSKGSTAIRSSRHKYSGDWAVSLTVASPNGNWAYLTRYFSFPEVTKLALFARFCWKSDLIRTFMEVDLYNGIGNYSAMVEYDLPNTTLKIYAKDDVWVKVDTALSLDGANYTWYPIMITFDLASGYYDKLYIADREYDISNIQLYYYEVVSAIEASVQVGAENITTGFFSVYVDDIIIAKNVP